MKISHWMKKFQNLDLRPKLQKLQIKGNGFTKINYFSNVTHLPNVTCHMLHMLHMLHVTCYHKIKKQNLSYVICYFCYQKWHTSFKCFIKKKKVVVPSGRMMWLLKER